VKNDFDTWLPKMSERGIILFHDIAVREKDFGVWKLWQDLRTRYPSYEVTFGFGLGVIATGREYPASVSVLFESSASELNQVREYFYQLGLHLELAQELDALKRSIIQKEMAALAHAQQLKRRHPLLTRTSNFLQLWANEGLTGALRVAKGKVSGAEANPTEDTSAEPPAATGKLLPE
jgi:hypothetical protein